MSSFQNANQVTYPAHFLKTDQTFNTNSQIAVTTLGNFN